MPIDFDKPQTGDNYATGVLPALRVGRVALAQWLDPAVAGTIGHAPEGAWRVKSASSGAVERFNGTSWEPRPINGVSLSGASVVVGASSPAAIGSGADLLAVSGSIGFGPQLNGRGAAVDIVNRTAGGHIDFYPASSRSMRLFANGNVAVGNGTSDNGCRLQVSGDVWASGTLVPVNTGNDGVVHGVTVNPGDNFLVESNVRVSHYGLAWANLPSQPAGSTAILSAYGGVRLFVQGAQALYVAAGGNTTAAGSLAAARIFTGFDGGVAGAMSCSGWFRSNGDSGWINQTHGGGIHMLDNVWVRTYGSKGFYCDQTIMAAVDITLASDERLKTNWRALPADLVERLAEVKCGVYDRIGNGVTQVGVSAQSLQTVMPHAVREGDKGLLTVAYGNAALAACVAMAGELVTLKGRVRELERA